MSLSTVLGPRFTDVPLSTRICAREVVPYWGGGGAAFRHRRYMCECVTGETVLQCQLSSQLSFSGDTLYMFTEFMH